MSLTQPSPPERALKVFEVSLSGGDLEGAHCFVPYNGVLYIIDD